MVRLFSVKLLDTLDSNAGSSPVFSTGVQDPRWLPFLDFHRYLNRTFPLVYVSLYYHLLSVPHIPWRVRLLTGYSRQVHSLQSRNSQPLRPPLHSSRLRSLP